MKRYFNCFAPILVLCVSLLSAVHAQQEVWNKSPKELFDMLGNPKEELSDQGPAYENLKDKAAYISGAQATNNIDAAYYLAECYVSGKTGKGGPDYWSNQKGFSPNRPEAYDLAVPLYEKAAEYDHIPSLVRLSAIYADEKYSGKDSDKSLTYLFRAAKCGDKTSLKNLSQLYSNGFPDVTSETQKNMAVEVLADNGYPEAQIEFSKVLISKNTKESLDIAMGFLVPLSIDGSASASSLLKEMQTKENDARVLAEKAAEDEKTQKELLEKQHAAEAQKAAADEASRKEAAKKQGVANQRSEKLASVLVTSVICMIAFIGLVGIKLIMTGVDWGMKEKAVVYDGKSDLTMSCVINFIFFVAAVLLCFGEDMWEMGLVLAVLDVFLLIYSVRKSYIANLNSVQKTLVVVPAKIFLSSLIVVAGLFSLGGIKSGIESTTKASRIYGNSAEERQERGKHKAEAAAFFMVAAFAAAAFFKLQEFAKKLVKEKPILK